MRLLDALLLEANETELDLSHLQLPYRDILIRKLLQQFDSNAASGRDLHANDRSFPTCWPTSRPISVMI